MRKKQNKFPSKDAAIIKEYNRLYYLKNKKAIRKDRKLWYLDNKKIVSERDKLYKIANQEKIKDRQRWYFLSSRYNIKKEEYEKLLEQQKGLCAICNNKPIKNLRVDHSHTTSKIRGLLCNDCNLGLGLFRDNTLSLQKAIKYLKKK